MKTVTLEEAEARLTELILYLKAGEEMTITVDGRPFAQVRRAEEAAQAGCAKTEGFWMAPDFDAPMDENGEFVG
jgi:antitoxin (DNA-binding transcriptional repressor) of toxin-antitoxin stability system